MSLGRRLGTRPSNAPRSTTELRRGLLHSLARSNTGVVGVLLARPLRPPGGPSWRGALLRLRSTLCARRPGGGPPGAGGPRGLARP
eukprot:14490144-Alexandrium_andersonii.AAC.1